MPTAFPFRAVIFDMDGVIVDTEAAYIVEQRVFLDEHGIDVPTEELNAMVGTSHETFVNALVDWWERGGYGIFTPDEAYARFEEWSSRYVYRYRDLLNPGVVETLDELARRGVRLALASSSRMDNILDVLGQCGITDRFEVIVSGEQFRESKPDPEIYLHAMERLGLTADECCCIEDSEVGITAGKRAGLTVFAKREERFGFSQAAADQIIDSVPDLLNVTRNHE